MVLEGRGHEGHMVHLRPGVPPPACLVPARSVLLPRRLGGLVHMGQVGALSWCLSGAGGHMEWDIDVEAKLDMGRFGDRT
jgi:hypothetical protein